MEAATTEIKAVENGHEPKGPSILGALREQHARSRQERHKDVPVPGYGGKLVVRYGVIDLNEVGKISDGVVKTETREDQLLYELDTLIMACRMVLFEGKPLHEYPEIKSETPIRFDVRLAKALDIDATSAREIVLGVFPRDGGPLMISRLAGDLLEWMRGADEASDEEFLGKS